LNLLPFPVLDGGQMMFATVARLRGRALPTNFVMAAQSVFFVLIFAMIGYISFFVDIPRIVRDARAERAAEAAAQPSAPAPAPAPAK
ncbi:MAG: site-2 protease family protein, partial [Candidatus Binataceae bacterium]